jgi:hypothetical protein
MIPRDTTGWERLYPKKLKLIYGYHQPIISARKVFASANAEPKDRQDIGTNSPVNQ